MANSCFCRFLLKYISREEVGLLERGNGGLAEVEEVVSRYEDLSPLYGFIQYRRRKVILKYIPEGTSRLLQGEPLLCRRRAFLGYHTKMKTARVTVQFQSVIEKLSPHDTVFSFVQSSDLRDSALSSACSLHTATESIKSSNDSLPQKGLAEITEDISESRNNAVEGRLSHRRISGDGDSEKIRPGKVNGFASADRTRHRSTSAATQNSFRSRTTSNTDKPLPPPPSEGQTREDRSPSPVPDYGEYSTRLSTEGRFSSNSTRPSTRDLYDAYGYKKKTKMGPRPSIDSVGAPNNLGTRTDEFRPVSTLPVGLRMPSRKAVPARPASQQAHTSPQIQTMSSVKPSLPPQANSSEKMTPRKPSVAPVAPIYIPDRNMPTPNNGLRTKRLPELGSPKMTPEKQRLMKALKLRKEQLAAQISVNGLGIESASDELEFSKPEIDDSILSAVIDASSPIEGSEPATTATKDLAKEGSRLLEDSPISMPETTEELSTQASSITDEEEAVAQKRQENHSTLIPSVLEHQYLSNDLVKDPHCHLTGRHEAGLEDPEKDLLTEDAVIESPQYPDQSVVPTQTEISTAGQDLVEHKVAGKESPAIGRFDDSPLLSGQFPAEEAGGDKQLSAQDLGSQTPRIPYIFGDEAPSSDQINNFTSKLEVDIEDQKSEPLGGYEKAASTGEAIKNEDLLQSQSRWDSGDTEPNLKINDQGRVMQSEVEQGHTQPLEHTVLESNGSVPRELPNDVARPLLVRRSSSSKSVIILSDNVNPHEVPLPPIDEDEEISLSPQRALFPEEAATRLSRSEGESITSIPQAKIPPQPNDNTVSGRFTLNGVGERHFRGQGTVNPIKRLSSPDQSDEQFLSDDSFMEELKSATVQEAKPISVSKSPIKPVFSRSESEQRLNGSARGSRSVSTPVDHSTKDREIFSSPRPPTPLSTTRSFSAQHSPRPDPQQSHVPISKKIGVSSSISQRIKALEQLSSRPKSPVSPKLAPNTSTFLGLRTTSLRTPSGGLENKNSSFNKARPDTAYPSPPISRETIKPSLPNQTNKADCPHPTKSTADTVVMTDTRQNSSENPSSSFEPRHPELHESSPRLETLKIPPPTDQKTMGLPPLSPLKPPRPRFGRYSSTRSGSSSSNEQKLEPQPTPRRDSFASIRSKSSRAGSEIEFPRTLSDSSQSGVTSLDGTQDEKKDSRRSRLLKRMSSISTMSRRTIAHALSPSPKEAPILERQEPIQEAPSTSVDIGDVNVQFPDNLVSSACRLLAHPC